MSHYQKNTPDFAATSPVIVGCLRLPRYNTVIVVYPKCDVLPCLTNQKTAPFEAVFVILRDCLACVRAR